MTEHVIKILGLISGEPSPYDDTYLARFDFDDCPPGEANLYTVDHPTWARKFSDVDEAAEAWKNIDPREPVRPDGKPNRPLTAFSVTIEPVKAR